MTFDPCREWLGIDALDLADPARALGLPAGRHAPAVIAEAARRRLEQLRGIDPGPFRKAHAAVMDRVAEARDRLLPADPAVMEFPSLQGSPPRRRSSRSRGWLKRRRRST